jgi:tetratricopeptide (TPR) repeat protein
MLKLEWVAQSRLFAIYAALALVLCLHAQAANARSTIGMLIGGPLMGADRQFPAETISEQQVRQLIAARGDQRSLLRQLASQHTASLNHRAGTSIYTEGVVAEMLRALLAQAVPQQSWSELLSLQAERFQRLLEEGTKAHGSGAEWEKPLQGAVDAAQSGNFGDADSRLIMLSQRMLDVQPTTASQRMRWQRRVAGVVAMRAHLAVVRIEFGEASLLYEEAVALYSDESAIEPNGWLLTSALVAAYAKDTPRALTLLDRVIEVSSVQLERGSPFAEWRLVKWMSEVQAAAIHSAAGNQADALKRFRASLDTEEGLKTSSLLKSPDLAYARWGVRSSMFGIHLKQNDTGSARQMLSQMRLMANALVKEQVDGPFAVEALWATQLTGALLDRVEGRASRAAFGYTEALETAKRLVDLRKASRASLTFLRESLGLFSTLPEGTLPSVDALAYGKERQRVANTLVQLDPDHLESSLALWDSYKNLVDVQVQMGNPGHALDDASSLLNVAQNIADRMPDDAKAVRNLFLSHEQYANLKMQTGSVVGAIDHYSFAVDVARKMIQLDPGNDALQDDLWNGLTSLSLAKLNSGNPGDSLTYQLLARDLTMANLGKGKDTELWQHNARYSFTKLGDLYRASGDLAEALKAFSLAVDFSRKVEQLGEAEETWSYSHWYALSKWGETLGKQRDFQAALLVQAEAKDYAERFAMSKDHQEEVSVALWFGLRNTGETLVEMGDVSKGKEEYLLALQLADRQLKDEPASATWQWYRQTSLAELEALKKFGQ